MATLKAVISHVKQDGTATVQIRVSHRSKAEYISTDIHVAATEFNKKLGKVSKGQNKGFINLAIDKLLIEYQQKMLEIENISVMSAKNIKQYLTRDNQAIDFYHEAKLILRKTDKDNTREWLKSAVERLRKFEPELTTAQINYDLLKRFEKQLFAEGLGNGVNVYMRAIRSLFNKMVDKYNDYDTGNIVIKNYPFKKYKIPKPAGNTQDHVLSVEELRAIISYETDKPNEAYARDMFVLMFCFIGIETVDLYNAKYNDDRVVYKRAKTGYDFSIKIEDEARRIIEKYTDFKMLIADKPNELRKFTKKINEYLRGHKARHIKGICARLGIDKKVTTKWARHTWATIARNECGISKDDISLCLGHKSAFTVTDVYIKRDTSIIDISNRKVLDFVFKP